MVIFLATNIIFFDVRYFFSREIKLFYPELKVLFYNIFNLRQAYVFIFGKKI